MVAAACGLTMASRSTGRTGSHDASTRWSVVMPALAPRATPVSVDDLVRLRILEACLEALTAENEILKPARVPEASPRRRRDAGDARNREGAMGDRPVFGSHSERPGTSLAHGCRRAGGAGSGEG